MVNKMVKNETTYNSINEHLYRISKELYNIKEQLLKYHEKKVPVTIREAKAVYLNTVLIEEKVGDIREILDMLKKKDTDII